MAEPIRSDPDLAPSRSRPAGQWLWLVLVLVLVEIVYVFVASAGLLVTWPGYMNYYDLLAEAFRAGQLHLPVSPPPELLAQKDPYDPAHIKLWFWDTSLHGGRYYLYFGPVPALLQALGKSMLRVNGPVGDHYLVFALFSLATAFGALIIERVARRLFPNVPPGLVALGMLALAFANPVPHLLASGGVYQAAIAGGQAFLLGGLLLAFDAVCEANGERRQRVRLILAGFAWALALGSRVSLGPAIALLVAVTALSTGWYAGLGWRRTFADATRLVVPVAVSLGALLLYNKLRFDAWFEFGTNNQLSTIKWRTSIGYVVPNLYAYLLRPFEASCEFPFALQQWHMGAKGLPGWIRMPADYLVTEPVVGWLRVVPLTWLLVVALASGLRRRREWLGPARSAATDGRVLRFCLVSFAVLGSVNGLPEIGLYMATMRFLADVSYGLVLLGILGGFMLYAAARSRGARVLVGGSFTLLCAATIGFGLLLGYQGYNGHFRLFHPDLHARLVEALSVCPKR